MAPAPCRRTSATPRRRCPRRARPVRQGGIGSERRTSVLRSRNYDRRGRPRFKEGIVVSPPAGDKRPPSGRTSGSGWPPRCGIPIGGAGRARVRGGRPNPAGRRRAKRSGWRPLLWWPRCRPQRPRRLVRGAGCRRPSGGRPWPRRGGRSAGPDRAGSRVAPTAAGGARRGGRGRNRHRKRGRDRRGGRQNSPPSKLPPEPRSYPPRPLFWPGSSLPHDQVSEA